MSRNNWLIVLIATVTLAIASIIPWMLSAPAQPRAQMVARVAGRASNLTPAAARAATAGVTPVVPRDPAPAVVAPGKPALPHEDQELVRVAVRGGLIAAGIAVLVLSIGWAFVARGGTRRRAITLTGRGLRLADVARQTRMSQDAVRTLMVPDVGARRKGVA